tara:strand:+ start:251 stop:496 length:246 start_codon:yes stop_codon:yes gene_type:complete
MARQDNKPTCEVCRLIRNYLIIAVPIIIVIYTQPEFSHLQGLNLTNLSAMLFGTAFVVVVLWKFYQEFWKPKRDSAKKQKP